MVRSSAALLVAALATPFAHAAEPIHWEMVNQIRDEGFNRSQVMATVEHLTDHVGPRVTGSPGMREANDWTRAKLEEWGLAAHLEGYEFGRGWSFSRTSVHLVAPRETPILAVPKAWTRGTSGKERGQLMKVKIESEKDFDEYRGKLKDKILLLPVDEQPRGGGPIDRPSAMGERDREFSDDALHELEHFPIPGDRGFDWRRRMRERRKFGETLDAFLQEEKVIATLERSSRENGILRAGGGGAREADKPESLTSLVIAAEHYNLLDRLLADDIKVELELDVKARFHTDDLHAYNTIGELAGTDPEAGLVMAGAHLDSWHAGTGATDNGAACAVMMEALRILKAVGAQPKRTIRIALWSGEEQGLLGSRAYVSQHFATRPAAEPGKDADPFEERWPLTLLPEHEKLSVYFNLDNGAGRVRGIWAQENAAAKPIFDAWLAPFEDVGAGTVTTRNTSSTDHVPFDRVGLPGFELLQDPLDYFSHTHHSNLDTFDALDEANLKQSAVVVASLLYHAAMRDERVPRKPLPQEPPKKDEPKGERPAPGSGHP